MKRTVGKWAAFAGIAALMMTSFVGCGTSQTQKVESEGTTTAVFQPALDTDRNVILDVAGSMGNFEALDQVVSDFNTYYPNVTVAYEQNDLQALSAYVENNSYVDIFMTNDANVRSKDQENLYVYDHCLDLSTQDIDLSAIDPEMIDAGTVDGKLVRLPLAKLMCGLVVNQTLLEKEGLEVPQTYEEFLSVCEALKEKGYTPIQSSKYHACSDLVLPMGMAILGSSDTLSEKVKSGDTAYADSLLPVYEALSQIVGNGYISSDVNDTYPDDNYDGAIMKFFEGDVPFWVTTSESYSGMKKRESKSEQFSKSPFEYAFIDAPMSADGAYVYEEPWYGFSVNKDSEDLDYAVEFMKFLAREEEINKLAEVKGMPSVAVNNKDERFDQALNPDKEAGRYINNGELGSAITSYICDTANKMGRGEIATADEAIQVIKERAASEN